MAVERFHYAKRHHKLLNQGILSIEFQRDLTIALSNCDWSADDPNALWKQFRERFNEVSNLHAPIMLKKVKSKYTHWLNEEIIRLMNYRDTLKKKAGKTKSSRFHEAYKTDIYSGGQKFESNPL